MIEYSNEGWAAGLMFQWRGSVIPLALATAIPSSLLTVILMYIMDASDEFERQTGFDSLRASQLWAGCTATMLFLVGFRTNKAYARFWAGTTLLHQMWGEWFDAVSCLIAFSTLSKKTKPEPVADFRHTLVRLMSLLHASALEEIALSSDDTEGYPALDIGGLDQGTLRYLKECKFNKELDFNRGEVLIHMIQTLIVFNQDNGVLKIPPPILSRVFQTLSRGQVNLANCKKITSTLFPFPYSQLIAFLLLGFALATPVMMAGICTHKFWGFMCTLVPVFGVFSLNYIARELEMPFGLDDNDLPLLHFQEHMNNSLLMLSYTNVDHLPHISARCEKDYFAMRSNISTARPRKFVEDRWSIENPEVMQARQELAEAAAKEMAPAPILAPAPVVEPAPEVAPVTVLPPAKPAANPSAPSMAVVTGTSGLNTSSLEKALQANTSVINDKYQELASGMTRLSEQLGQNTEVLVMTTRGRNPTFFAAGASISLQEQGSTISGEFLSGDYVSFLGREQQVSGKILATGTVGTVVSIDGNSARVRFPSFGTVSLPIADLRRQADWPELRSPLASSPTFGGPFTSNAGENESQARRTSRV